MSKVHRFHFAASRTDVGVFAFCLALALFVDLLSATPCTAQTCIQLRGQAYSQNFNSLPVSGANHGLSTLPTGFSFIETGSGADTTYAANDGGLSTSNTYSFGGGTDTDRALGEITGLAVRSFCGVCFINNTGFTIPSISVNFAGEQWRLGTADAVIDRLDFQYSKTATSPGDNAAAWTNVDALDFYTPTNTGAGAKDGNGSDNRQVFPPTTILPAGGLPIGGKLYLRWVPVDVAGNDDGLAIDDFRLTYSPSADFNLDGFVNGVDLLRLQRNFGTTTGASVSMGDANRDGAVTNADITIWRAQFGAFTPASGAFDGLTTPEPAGIGLFALAAVWAAVFLRGRRRGEIAVGDPSYRFATHRSAFVGAAWLAALVGVAPAQNVSLSLNVFPTLNANPNTGGTWMLVAKTDAANGIAAIDAFLTGINPASVVYGTGINAATTGGVPYVIAGTPNELVYFQDFALGGIVVGVGKPTFRPGLDLLGSATWDNATWIASGTYSGTAPAFAANSGNRNNAANVLSTSTPPFTHADAAATAYITRLALSGDYNLNGIVEIGDYVVWRNHLGNTASLYNDGTPGVGPDDYTRWRANLGTTASGGASSLAETVPEPSAIWLWMLAVACLMLPSLRIPQSRDAGRPRRQRLLL